MFTEEIIQKLKNGGVGVIPTDTLYGLVGSALNEGAVERVYRMKGRTPSKPCIVLIGNRGELARFGADTAGVNLETYWPGPVSIVLTVSGGAWSFLDRGTGTIAFRLPDDKELQAFLRLAGPLVAPSANPEGLPPAETVDEARKYFGESADFYVDGGRRSGRPSALVSLADGTPKILRGQVGLRV